MKKFSIMFASVAMLFGVGLGVGAAVSSDKSEPVLEAKADVNLSGSLIAKLGNIGKWSMDSAKLCAYLTDDTSTYWTDLQTLDSGTILYKFDYSINFTPTKLVWVRMNPDATSGNWGQKWNQTSDLGWAEATYIKDVDNWDPTADQCVQWTVSAEVRSSAVDYGTKAVLSTIGINGEGNPEVSGSVSLEKDEEFKMFSGDNVWSCYYGCPSALDNAIDGGNREGTEGGNIVCLIAGTYDFYFDTETKKLWISRQDIVDADGWAEYFLNNVGCDATGEALPSGWSLCASAYNSLTDAAKDFVYGSEADEHGDNLGRALARYDHAVKNHSELDRFIKNSSKEVRPVSGSSFVTNEFNFDSNDNMIVIISIIAAVTVASLAALLIIKKRKHN